MPDTEIDVIFPDPVITDVIIDRLGPAGVGVPAGGLAGQRLAKASNTSFDTEWVDPSVIATTWGAIGGTLSNQVDLQNALNAKEVPLTFSDSLSRAANTITLKNDSAAPGASKYYGTDGGSTLGYFNLPSGASPANPTASVGLTAVNGSNATFLRSDGAPALDQTIIPTWTGLHTFSGGATVSGSSLILSGNQSAAAWTTTGIRLRGISGTLTDTTSSGTVAAAYTNKLGGNAIAASNATTFTDYTSLYVSDPSNGANVTITNKWSLGADSAKIGTSNALTISSSGVLTATSPVLTTPKVTTGINDANGNSMLAFTATGSAVDGFTFTNAATANPATVTMAATGSDSNVHIALTPKGTGIVKAGTTSVNHLYLGNTTDNSYGLQADTNGIIVRTQNNSGMFLRHDLGVMLNAGLTGRFGWGNLSTYVFDTGLGRNAAGVVEINNGTPGTFRDLITRSIGLGGSPSGTNGDIAVAAPAVAGTSTAGNPLTLEASNATAGNVTNGAAAGGNVTITAGNAARLNSGNANGGNIILSPGAPVGTGTYGVIKNGVAAMPVVNFVNDVGGAFTGFLFTNGSTPQGLRLSGDQVVHDAAGYFGWTNNSSTSLGNADTAIARNAAGVVEINNGTAGTLADLKARYTTLTGAGAASTSALTLSGVPFAGTGTTSFPLLYVNDAAATASTTLNTAGTSFGVNQHGTSDLMNLMTDGVSKFKVASTGAVTGAAGFTIPGNSKYGWAGASIINCTADGNIILSNNAATGFSRLDFQGTSNSASAIGWDAINGLTFQSAAGTSTWNDNSTAASGTVANRYLVGIAAPTLTATNATVTDTVASTVYIGGAPTASTNTTIGTAYALNVAAGNALFGGNIGVGGAPSARLTLPAGGTAAGTAPLKFTTQANPLTVVEQGTMELVGNSLQFTQLAKRRGVAMTDSTRTTDTTWAALANGTTESGAIITAPHGANYLEVGKMEEITLIGTIAQRSNANAVLTARVKYAGSTVLTFATTGSTAIAANSALLMRVYTTCRTTGASGSMQINAVMEINGTATDPQAAALPTIDTTTAQDTTITFQWGTDNDASNTVTINQGRVLCIEPNR